MNARALLSCALVGAWVLAAGCANTRDVAGRVEAKDAPPSFMTADASTTEVEAGITSYCPSNKCPAGFTTCPSSRFPCDTDLRRDSENCGACGVSCPPPTGREKYECIEGRCTLQCRVSPLTLDCDGVDDNGCETDPGSNDHCAACGDQCLDPAKPCVKRTNDDNYGCGCTGGKLYCPTSNPKCVDAKNHDGHCGACGNACDPGAGGAPPPNAHFGCVEGECGHLKCEQNYGNCDSLTPNGCETYLVSRDNCGSCGNVCPAGQECRLNALNGGMPECMCPPSQTFCPLFCSDGVCAGECTDIASDVRNCGACGFACRSSFAPYSTGVCTYGTCTRSCAKGRADCNDNPADDCEVDIDSDPRNCGACGTVCDAIAGQACVGGQCVVEPCDQDDAGVAR